MTDVSGPLYGVEPRADALELRLGEGGSRSVLVLDRTVTTASADEFGSAPSLWGVMLTPDEETGDAEPSLLAVAAPTDDDGVAATFVRPDGKAIYAGRGVSADGGFEFALTDTGLVGTMPTRLRLRVGAELVALADGTVDLGQAVTRTPEPGPG